MSIKTYQVEPYAKENNLLQLSLFYFGKGKPEKTMVKWKNEKGDYQLKCDCSYGVPGSFEQDVYTACMRLWVKQGMEKHYIKVNYSEIARELNLSPPRAWVSHIKKSLHKLGQARYEFHQCFLKATEEGTKEVTTHFSLFDTATLFNHRKGQTSKKKSESRLSFPDQIRDNLEAKYYQTLDMVWYRALTEGLPRRLYEYLEKRRYHNVNGFFTIAEELICRWLPITDTNPSRKKSRLRKIAGELVQAGYLESFKYDKKKSLCVFQYAKKGPPKGMVEPERIPVQEQLFEDDQIPLNPGGEVDHYQKALEWIRTVRYFRTTYLKKIQDLPRDSVIETFPHVRSMWDKGKIDKPGGIYKAFMESWRDQDLLAEKEDQMAQEKQEKALVTSEAYQVVHAKFLAPIEEERAREEVNLVETARKTREEAQAKEEEEDRRKRENHKMEVITYIAQKGKENLLLMGCEILDVDFEKGITIKKGDEERLIKYGNVLVGANLK